MKNNTQQLIHNTQQQTKRLLDQLKQLEENRQDLGEQEYSQLKQSTLQELTTFQNSLNNLLQDPNNSILESELQKTKRAILQACKSEFNKDEIVNKILSQQAKGTRMKIAQLQKQYHLKSIPEKEYVGQKRKFIVEIEETGAKLSAEERDWLNLHHHFVEKGGEEVKEEMQKNQVLLAQKKLQMK